MNRDDVIKKEFPHAFIGYDVAEVDLFLDEVIREFDRLHNEIEVLNFRLDRLASEGMRAADEMLGDGAKNNDAHTAAADVPEAAADAAAQQKTKDA